VIKRGDSNTFYEQINALNDSIVQEWRELGNQAEKFGLFWVGGGNCII
jgi:hypothetical protein